MNKVLLGLGSLVAVLVIFSAINYKDNSRTNTPKIYSNSELAIVENNFNFETIDMKDGLVSNNFEVKNEGLEPVIIEKVYTSCMCTSASIIDSSNKEHGAFGMPGHGLPSKTNITVSPGESVTVKAIFDPAAHGPSGVGLASRSIYLETNSSKNPKVDIRFSALVKN